LAAAGYKSLAEGQEVYQDLQNDAGISTNVTAVGKDLGDQLEVKTAGCLLKETLLVVHRQRDGGERDHNAQARQTGSGVVGNAAQVTCLADQRLHEAAVKLEVATFENERRVRLPGDQAAGDDLRIPRDAVVMGGEADPLVDEAARI